ncbi:MAG: hypothetical protein CL910_14980 [Deltaproteobacteria bacterium]|jgi:osmotically-inducible protein OsmY|nr:hypothetical protein [Deltaproteobacteria bacterium]
MDPVFSSRSRSRNRLTTRSFLAPVALAAFLLLGCGEKSAEEMLEDANQELSGATAAKDAAKVTLDQLEKRLADAQGHRDEAALAYEEARQRWLAAKDAVGEFATDEVLHRQVNRALLEAPELVGSTVTAQVEDRLVSLVGTAASAEAAARAEELAEEVPGVAEVISRLTIGEAPVASPGDASEDPPSEDPEAGTEEEEPSPVPELDLGPDLELEGDEEPAVSERQI